MHSSFLQFGRLHFPVFGIFAALGLMAALTLSQRTARYAALSPEAVWNAGVTAILSAFVVSRLLLVAFNFQSFVQYPLLVLALPSLTATGILVTILVMLGYVRWRRIPLLLLLDAEAPCVALLWAFLSLGQYFGGTRDGMPTRMWPIASSPIATRPQPVEILTAIAAFLIAFRLLITLKKKFAAPHLPAGVVTAVGLGVSGMVIFFLDFYRLPSDLMPNAVLDPSQIIGIAMILVGAALLMRAHTQVKQESGNEPPDAV